MGESSEILIMLNVIIDKMSQDLSTSMITGNNHYHVRQLDDHSENREISCLNLTNKRWKTFTLCEILDFTSQSSLDSYVVFFMNLRVCELRSIRKAYDLHPVIDIECVGSDFNVKDQILSFGDYTLLTISDINRANDLNKPISLKIVYSHCRILIFCQEPLYCLTKVSADEDFLISGSSSFWYLRELGTEATGHVRIDIGREQGCSDIDSALYKILDALVVRLETFIVEFEIRARDWVRWENTLYVGGTGSFFQSMSIARRELIALQNVVKPKTGLLKKLKRHSMLGENCQSYLSSLISRCRAQAVRLETVSDLLKTASDAYEASVEESLAVHSIRLSAVMKHFSAIATIFLPLSLIGSLFGMNVEIPMAGDKSL